jgi:hypothetical protein
MGRGKVMALEVCVKDCAGLACADEGGKSDPYAKVYFNSGDQVQ